MYCHKWLLSYQICLENAPKKEEHTRNDQEHSVDFDNIILLILTVNFPPVINDISEHHRLT